MACVWMGVRRSYGDGYKALPRRCMAVGLVATVTGILTCALVVQPASAGTYVMRNCSVPGHGSSLFYPWRTFDNPIPNVSVADSCTTGGGVAITLGEPRQMGGGYSPFVAIEKPTGSRGPIKFVKLMLWYAARLAGSGQALHFWSGDRRSDGKFHSALSYGPPGSENLVAEQQLSPDTTSVQIGIQCGPGGVVSPEPCVAANDVPLLIRGVEVTLSEDVQPTVVLRPGGSLLNDGAQSGTRTLTYSASDLQSGLSKVDVLLDDTVVGSQDLTPRCSYADFTVCPASVDETLQVDTRAVANGRHGLTLRVRDAAGNERAIEGGHAVDVANEQGPNSTSGSPAFALIAKFNGTSRTTITVPYGRRVVVRGRLTQGGRPVAAGTALDVLERPDARGTPERAAGRFETKADGSFSTVVATNRPSRVLRLAYRPANGSQVVSRPLRLRVGAASRLRASLHGRLIRFSGRVLSGPIAKRGKRLLMEGRSPGAAWTQFRILRTDSRGRFSGTYRLRVRRPGVVLKVRAVVPSENGYGYLRSSSRAVSLRVR